MESRQLSRRRFVRNAAIGLLVLTLMSWGSTPIPLGFWTSSVASGISSAAQAALDDWVTRVQGQTNDVTIAGTRTAVGIYIDGLMTDGVWSKIARHSINAGDGLAALRAPLKNTTGPATDSLVNFVAGDYSQATGLTGNTTTKYVNTGLAASSAPMGDNDISIAIYVRTGSDEVTTTCGTTDGAKINTLQVSQAGSTYWDCSSVPAGRITVVDAAGTGLYVGSRTSTSSSVLYKNGTSIGTDTDSGALRSTRSIYFHAMNNNGTVSLWSSRTHEMYAIGTGLTATEVSNLTSRYATLRTALGR